MRANEVAKRPIESFQSLSSIRDSLSSSLDIGHLVNESKLNLMAQKHEQRKADLLKDLKNLPVVGTQRKPFKMADMVEPLVQLLLARKSRKFYG